MRRLIAITLAATLLLGVVSCAPGQVIPKLFDSITVYGMEQMDNVDIEGNIMAVFYTKSDACVIFWCSDATIIDMGDGTWDIYDHQGHKLVEGMNQALVDYGLYQYQEIERPYEEVDGTPVELPIYLDDLDLQPITGDDLPHSEHIGKLTAVNPALAKPATVTRRYMGINYDIQCFVTQSIVDQWLAEDLGIGDFVLISFVEESPNGVEKHVAIVTDKVYESWG